MEEDWTENPFTTYDEDSPSPTPINLSGFVKPTSSFHSINISATPSEAADKRSVGSLNTADVTEQVLTPSITSQSATLAERELRLQEREKRLRLKEDEIERRLHVLNSQSAALEKRPNWPPFPEWCIPPFVPWIYHSITNEIPADNRKLVFLMFNLWKFHCLCYFLNFLAALSFLRCGRCSSKIMHLVLALLYVIAFVPGSFVLWYRSLYRGFQKDKSISFMVFFFVFGFQILANAFLAIGVQGSGGGGWISAVATLKESTPLGFFISLSASFWTLNFMLCIYMFKRIHYWYRGSEYTAERAQNEIVAGAAQNETIRRGVLHSILK